MMKKWMLFAVLSALLISLLSLTALAKESPLPLEGYKEITPVIEKGNKSEIDIANKDYGYVKVKINTSDKRYKLRIQQVDSAGKEIAKYEYDAVGNNTFANFPLQMGDGNYIVSIWENTTDKKYSKIQQSSTIKVKYAVPNAPYLVPIQIVDFSATSKAAKKAAELCKGKTTEIDKVNAIYTFVIGNIKYDADFAKNVVSGKVAFHIPSADKTLESSKGICYDYSSLMAAMLRSQGIACKVIKGDVPVKGEAVYHAWSEVFIKDVGWVKVGGSFQFDGKNFSRMDATFSSSNGNGAHTSFIGDGSNYIKKMEY